MIRFGLDNLSFNVNCPWQINPFLAFGIPASGQYLLSGGIIGVEFVGVIGDFDLNGVEKFFLLPQFDIISGQLEKIKIIIAHIGCVIRFFNGQLCFFFQGVSRYSD